MSLLYCLKKLIAVVNKTNKLKFLGKININRNLKDFFQLPLFYLIKRKMLTLTHVKSDNDHNLIVASALLDAISLNESKLVR
jgi:hypothetical protein